MIFDEEELRLLEKMYLIRRSEEKLLELFSLGLLNGTVHTCIGQEACSVGVTSALTAQDIVVSNHRSHGHYIAFGGSLGALFAEIMGKRDGVCRGICGSQHLHFKNFYSNGILGGMIPVATGVAFAEKEKQTQAVVAVFLGDGAMGEGVVYESFNMAALWQLPILYVIEANGVAQSTPIARSIAGSLNLRAEAFGIPVRELPACSPKEVAKVTGEMVRSIRSSHGPQCLILNTYRLGPHSKGDDERPKDEIARAGECDILNSMLRSCPAEVRSAIESRVNEEIRKGVEFAKNGKLLEADEFWGIIRS